MRLTYVLLSPTFGMHQYTADLANRGERWNVGTLERANVGTCERGNVDLVTTTTLPRDRYSAAVQIHTPVTTHGTGFSAEGLDLAAYRRIHNVLACERSNVRTLERANVGTLVHFTGVHLWNVPLVYALRRRGVPVIHTLHDLEPHHGVRHGGLIRLWNRLIISSGCVLLVHGRRYRDQLVAAGVPGERITYAPLLHGFLSAAHRWPPASDRNSDLTHSVVFFGRVELYKGIDILLAAWAELTAAWPQNSLQELRLIIAGPVAPGVALPPLPPGVELRDRRILDDEGDALFRSASLLVLPYRDATQSALVAAAYAYGVPVITSDSGALAEYVAPGETGWVVPSGDAPALAAALREALSDPGQLSAMGATGRQWFDAQRREEEMALRAMYGA